MSRRPSLLASSSSSSISTLALGNGHAGKAPAMMRGVSSHRATSGSISKMPTNNMDPDELFVKHSISEIKLIQQRLRADADAKQEELRLMVGERYRDLLQASTSIISIARSSKRVIEALADTRSAILAEHPPSLPKQTSIRTNEDTHLQALQILAAHIKLLLDVPEHLWRMLEKKKYFTAAWLYLLSRVVHHALVREEQDEEMWRNQGIDVLEQFPLVQRQWEVVAQFRPQIVHKAALSLRDFTASSENTCTTLLTLHLLDSRPLSDTLVALLDQRSKSLQIIFAKIPSPRGSIREIKNCILVALDSISQTMKTCRDVFQTQDSRPSLIRAILEFIQTDVADPALPSDLQLTTQTLLTGLPSSAHFSMLPQNLKSYKPHVDTNSQFSSLAAGHLDMKLSEWFQKFADRLQISCETWLLDAQSVKAVWSIRTSVCSWMQSSTILQDSEAAHLKSIFDKICRKRILEIWKSGLSNAETAFHDQLYSAVSSARSSSDASRDASPITHLFDAPTLPSASQLEGSPLLKYCDSLQRQLLGRTSLLDSVLKTLEKCAAALQEDLLQVLHGDDDDTRLLISRLQGSYQPFAQDLCKATLSELETSISEIPDNTDLDMDALVFVGHVVEELSSSSPFISDISCDRAVAIDFREKARSLYNTIVDRWRDLTVSRTLSRHRVAITSAGLKSRPCVSPSVNLTQSLLSLAEAIQKLGFSREPSRHAHLADQTLHLFVCRLLSGEWEQDGVQMLHDIAFLRKLAGLWGQHWSDVCEMLDARASQIRESTSAVAELPDDETLSSRSSDYIAKTQTLFGAVLPYPAGRPIKSGKTGSSNKYAALLPLGVPSSDQEYRAALEIAKPSSRFALLLVD